jgi:hypothetical protein
MQAEDISTDILRTVDVFSPLAPQMVIVLTHLTIISIIFTFLLFALHACRESHQTVTVLMTFIIGGVEMGTRVGLVEAAEHTGLSQSELRRGALAGRYPYMRLGDTGHGKMIFDIDLLEEAIKARMLASIAPPEQPGGGKIRRISP